jgi:hypothetical protein
MSKVMECPRCGENAVWTEGLQLGSTRCTCPCHQPGHLLCDKEAS